MYLANFIFVLQGKDSLKGESDSRNGIKKIYFGIWPKSYLDISNET